MSKSSRMNRNAQNGVAVLDPDHVEDGEEVSPMIESFGTAIADSIPLANGTHAVEVAIPPASIVEHAPNGSEVGASSANLVFDSCDAEQFVPPIGVHAVEITVPMIDVKTSDAFYVGRRIDVTLDDKQSRMLRGIFNGLHGLHRKLANGRHVDSDKDAVRWMLDQLIESGERSKIAALG